MFLFFDRIIYKDGHLSFVDMTNKEYRTMTPIRRSLYPNDPQDEEGGPLRAGIITNWEIPKSASAQRINEILLDLYLNDEYWRIIQQYHNKFYQPLIFALFNTYTCDISSTLCLMLSPFRNMVLRLHESHTYINPKEWGPQLQSIFMEGDKFFYVDRRPFASKNKALLVANKIVGLAELAIDPDTFYEVPSKPAIKPEDVPLEFKRNLELAIQTASDSFLAGHLIIGSKLEDGPNGLKDDFDATELEEELQ